VTGDLGSASAAAEPDVYARLIADLDTSRAHYRLIEHAPERLELIADPALLDCDELYFNAGRLDRSVALASQDYLRLAGPRIARIIAT
jgi:hypothetical protein